jgi:hypothetical protein
MTYKKIIIGIVFFLLVFNVEADFIFENFKQDEIEEYTDYVLVNFQDEMISIKSLESEELLIYKGKPPQELLDSNRKIVYFVENYYPEKKIGDISRTEGQKRLTAVVKDAKVEIENGILVRTDGLKINIKSVLEAESFEDRQIDHMSTKVTEIFGLKRNIFFRISDFMLSEEYGRGFYTEVVSEFTAEFDEDEEFIEVVPNTDCSKFGFVFYPETYYPYLSQTSDFTKDKGYALGVAVSRYDNYKESLENMKLFVEESYENGLVPIIRIIGTDWYSELPDPEIVVKFIKDLKEETEGKLEYIQISDKPNLAYLENNYFTYPENYANYVIDVKNMLNDNDIKIISASLSLGLDNPEIRRNNSLEYLDSLLKIERFWESIDYWASSAYNKDITEKNYCMSYDEASMIEAENICLSSIYAYGKELNRIFESTGKQYDVFLTDIGYPIDTEPSKFNLLFKHIKEDPRIKGSLIFLANGWTFYEGTNWIDITSKEIIDLNKNIDVCN